MILRIILLTVVLSYVLTVVCSMYVLINGINVGRVTQGWSANAIVARFVCLPRDNPLLLVPPCPMLPADERGWWWCHGLSLLILLHCWGWWWWFMVHHCLRSSRLLLFVDWEKERCASVCVLCVTALDRLACLKPNQRQAALVACQQGAPLIHYWHVGAGEKAIIGRMGYRATVVHYNNSIPTLLHTDTKWCLHTIRVSHTADKQTGCVQTTTNMYSIDHI